MAELRADLCRLSVEEVERLVEIRPNLIATCRIANSSEAFAREQLAAAIRRGARYVDIEIEAPDEHLEYVRTLAREYGCWLIVSFHDFEGTPSLDELKGIARLCRTKGADLVKIVTTAWNISDAARTMRLYDLQADGALFEGAAAAERPQLVAFSMGEAGKFTRLLCLKLGAPYTYVSAGASNATASGQYTREEMERLLSAENYPFEGFREFRRTTVAVPCSKSVAQRAVLAAALAAGESRLANYAPCNDIVGAVEVIRGMGCRIASDGTTLHIEGVGAERLGRCTKIETGESGLLTRLLTPLASHISALNGGAPVEISGHGSILKRNLHEAVAALREAGVHCSAREEGYLPFRIEGGITRREISFSGRESSQTVSGFLMTLPLLQDATVLTVTEPSSIPYLELTLRTLTRFGVRLNREAFYDGVCGGTPSKIVFSVPGRQEYRPSDVFLEADWSSAAYFAVAGAVASSLGRTEGITLRNMRLDSLQADEKILDILRSCGADVSVAPADASARGDMPGDLQNISATATGRRLKAFEVDATHCPDLFPILAVLAAHCDGTSRIAGVGRLTQKESNRAETIYAEFRTLGARIDIRGDEMFVTGGPLHGGDVRSHNDHRIAMSLIVAGLFTPEPVRLDDVKCIDKSFPSFLDLLARQE
ncbi:3-phosphoshikimate 1-carboxyvinyltransferase [Alistipes putredinis]|jgi:3-phosphoshikimate 1-carboxyvinyltransferase|nr:3-phosphoshikimate 1-carboxyvinyltransferase [Alistipes putredinis]